MQGGLALLRNLPGVAQQHNVFIYCLPARSLDCGAHGVSQPPCIEGGIA
jgi:hypothetical protein